MNYLPACEGAVIHRTPEAFTYASDVAFAADAPLENGFDNRRDTCFVAKASNFSVDISFSVGYAINQYCLVSGDRDNTGDPKTWAFYGSADGAEWVPLDARQNERFEGRQLKRRFEFQNTTPYPHYRLSVTQNGGADTTALTEIQLYEVGGYPSWALGPFEKLDEYNPIIRPNDTDRFFDPVDQKEVRWSEEALYNPAAVVKDHVVHVLYRSQDHPLVSRVGLATSEDGVVFQSRPTPVLYPDNDFMLDHERGGGCEDPRIVKTPDGRYVMHYSAYNRVLHRCRLAVATSTDLVRWEKHGLAFAGKYSEMWSKSAAVICDPVGDEMIAHRFEDGKYWMYWGEGNLYLASSEDFLHWTPLEDERGNLLPVLTPRQGYFDSGIVEAGPTAIITDKGVLVIYNGANNHPETTGDDMIIFNAYTPGQALFDIQDLTRCIGRTEQNFMYPEKDYELVGLVNNVCFVEGLVYHRDAWYLYYGTADSRLAVARFDPAKPTE